MRTFAALLAAANVSALDGGKVAELLQFFEANQNRYQINVEQYCKFGDLPLMEMTEYGCLDVIEDSLTDGKTCSFVCKNDAGISGNVECICDNDENAVTEAANCKWKFPAFSSQCGPARMAYVDAELADLNSENDQREADIAGLDTLVANLDGSIGDANDGIAENTAEIANKHAEAIQAISNEGADQDADRAALEAALTADIADLQAADIAQTAVVTANGDILGDVVDLANDHSEVIQNHTQEITAIEQTLADHSIDIASLDAELDTETGNLLTSLNEQILKQQNEHDDMQDEVTNNYNHFTDMDDLLNTAILSVKDDLTQQITDGAVMDQEIHDHDTRFLNVESDIDSNAELIALTQDELNDKFLFLTNYTDNAVEAKGLQIDSDMDTLSEEQDAANDALAAADASLWAALNNTNSDLAAEEARGDDQDTTLDDHQDQINDLATDIATNVDGIDTVQTNLDHEVEVMGLDVELKTTELQAAIDLLRSDMELEDASLEDGLSQGGDGLNLTSADLENEVAAGQGRDNRLDLIEADTATIFDNIDDINSALDQTMFLMKTNDTALETMINDNMDTVTTEMEELATELREKDQELVDMDTDLQQQLDDTNTALDEEVQRGEDRDDILTDHEERMVAAEADLVDKQQQLDDTNQLISDNFDTLDTKIDDTDTAIRDDMTTMRDELDTKDQELTDEDTAINTRIDDTNDALDVETTRNDDQDVLLQEHADELVAHQTALDQLDQDIQDVQTNLDDAVETINERVDDEVLNLDNTIEDLESAMEDADEELTEETERLDDEISDTQADLDLEVSAGEIRQEELNDHNVRLTVMRGDVDANAQAIAGLGGNTAAEIDSVVHNMQNQSDVTFDHIYEMDRRLSFEDSNLRNEDTKIRGEMSTQKFLLEKKMQQDIDTVDRAIRNHFANEIYQTDNKLTNSINALSHKQQEDIQDIHAALDFFWGVYRPQKLTLFEGVFQPQVGHLITIIPHVYRIWHLEVDIMPYKKNHYSWVNLLHFTASGDNYGRPGDRMPLISLYPGENILHVASYVNNEVSSAYDSDYILPMHRWTKLEIGQTYLQGQFVYYIKLNNKQVFSIVNRYPMDFFNMMVYGCDPWSEMPNVKLRNLYFTTSWGPNIVSNLSPMHGHGYGHHHHRGEGDEETDRSAGMDGIDATDSPSVARSAVNATAPEDAQ